MYKTSIFLFLFFLSVSVSGQMSNDGTLTVPDSVFQGLKDLSKSKLAKGEIYLMYMIHQDIAWLEQPEAMNINLDTMWLTPFFERLEREPDFRMDIENSLDVMTYIHRRPDKKDLIEKYLKEGRISIGATYTLPYEGAYYGESLARQFYHGKRWLKETFDGYNSLTYFNVDVPGRTLQIPQIMAKAGVENLVVGRHNSGLFYWEAPDGSKVRTYSPGYEGNHTDLYYLLLKDNVDVFDQLAKESAPYYNKYNNAAKTKAIMPAMFSWELVPNADEVFMYPVNNLDTFTSVWNSVRYIRTEGEKKTKVQFPQFRWATTGDFFRAMDQLTTVLPTIKGARPNTFVYGFGPSHEREITASRQGDIWLPVAEKMASFNALANGNFMYYPGDRLSRAWEAKIYPDHGIGGKNGDITDLTFLRKFEFALSEANTMLDEGARSLASQVRTETSNGIPVVVFNTLSWKRNDPVNVPIQLEKEYAGNISVKDASGKNVPCQLSNIQRHTDGSIHTADLHFVAIDVPSLGYTTFYIVAQTTETSPQQKRAANLFGIDPLKTQTTETPIPPPVASNNSFENRFYRIELAEGGIKQITDKELGFPLLDVSKFLGGEVITMKSEGWDVGTLYDVQQPTMEGFDKVSNHLPRWMVKENGDVFTSFFYRSKIRNAVVEQTVTLYHQIKKIDFDIAIINWDGILFREYRMMLPVGIVNGEVAYEVPFGILRVGKDEMPGIAGSFNGNNFPETKNIRPRAIGNWIGVSGKEFGVTLSSSAGTADYQDPTDHPVANAIIQPILFASRTSCHHEGNKYLQMGDHHFHFSLTSHTPGWEQGYRFGQAANENLKAVFAPRMCMDAALPHSFSFFNIQNENVVVSAIKKCEDDESLIIRLYNVNDQTEAVKLSTKYMPKTIFRVNLIEEEIEQVNEIKLGKYAIETYKLKYK
jgi:alpha-mannosidase